MLQCYYINLEGGCSYEQSLSLYERLPEDRKKKVSKQGNKDLVRKQILTGVFLQQVLAGILGVEESDIIYEYNSHGKPSVKDSWLFFNMSHSGDYAVLAVSDTPVGIDVEHVRKNRLSVAKRCFCPEEYEDIVSAGDEVAVGQRFLEYWTMKEAYVKYLGKGLLVPLNTFCIMRKEPISRVMIPGNGSSGNQDEEIPNTSEKSETQSADDIFLRTYKLDNDYCIAVCSQDEEDVSGMEEKMWVDNNNVTEVHLFG